METAIDSAEYEPQLKASLATALMQSADQEVRQLRSVYPIETDRLVQSSVGLVERFLVETRRYWKQIEYWDFDVKAGKTNDIGTHLYIRDELVEWLRGAVFRFHERKSKLSSGSHSGLHVPWTGQTPKPGSHNSPS